jgi:hypothetical protein
MARSLAGRSGPRRAGGVGGKGMSVGKGKGTGADAGKVRRSGKRPSRGARDTGAQSATGEGTSFRGLARRAPIQPGTAVGRGVRTAGR